MKKLLLHGVSLLPLTFAWQAEAADLPVKAPPPATAYDWTGVYFGGNAGGVWGAFDPTTSVVNGVYFGDGGITSGISPISTGMVNGIGQQRITTSMATAGVQAGANWQNGSFVLGIEADFEAFHLSGNSTRSVFTPPFSGPPSLVTATISSQSNTNWLFTARPRIGFAADNWLLYATGGLAVTDLHSSFAYTDNWAVSKGVAAGGGASGVKLGYAIGAGAEIGLSRNWTVKLEYLHVGFGSVSGTSNNLFVPDARYGTFPTQIFTHSTDLKADIGRVGFNYRF
jgi:outer membrane immunogenic protein